MPIAYTTEPDLTAKEFIDLLNRSGLAARRPVDEPERIAEMVQFASLMLCARDGDKLVGIARAVTDFSFCCYLSDLAVDKAYQGQKIGQELMRLTHEASGGGRVTFLLLEAPTAAGYYGHVGFEKASNAWLIARKI
ncbi:MAG: GNAT family N-acetyltransferase [candidate division Zixibacteria bacterium]|nr:GNAT family N-acetyltransferase [candidate division Zixibacteria bacterium]